MSSKPRNTTRVCASGTARALGVGCVMIGCFRYKARGALRWGCVVCMLVNGLTGQQAGVPFTSMYKAHPSDGGCTLCWAAHLFFPVLGGGGESNIERGSGGGGPWGSQLAGCISSHACSCDTVRIQVRRNPTRVCIGHLTTVTKEPTKGPLLTTHTRTDASTNTKQPFMARLLQGVCAGHSSHSCFSHHTHTLCSPPTHTHLSTTQHTGRAAGSPQAPAAAHGVSA